MRQIIHKHLDNFPLLWFNNLIAHLDYNNAVCLKWLMCIKVLNFSSLSQERILHSCLSLCSDWWWPLTEYRYSCKKINFHDYDMDFVLWIWVFAWTVTVVDVDSSVNSTSSHITSVPLRWSLTGLINNLDTSGTSYSFEILEHAIVNNQMRCLSISFIFRCDTTSIYSIYTGYIDPPF